MGISVRTNETIDQVLSTEPGILWMLKATGFCSKRFSMLMSPILTQGGDMDEVCSLG